MVLSEEVLLDVEPLARMVGLIAGRSVLYAGVRVGVQRGVLPNP